MLAFAYLGGISTVGGAVVAGTLFAEGIGIVVTNEWFIDVGPYTAYVAGFFLIATAVYNNEGIDGFQRTPVPSAGEPLAAAPGPRPPSTPPNPCLQAEGVARCLSPPRRPSPTTCCGPST